MEEEIIKIVAKILKMSPQKIEKIDNYEKMDNLDSLAQLDIISALDKRLNGKIGKIKNIDKMIEDRLGSSNVMTKVIAWLTGTVIGKFYLCDKLV